MRWQNYRIRFSPFGYEDFVRHSGSNNHEFVVFNSMLDLVNDIIDRDADIVWSESPEALLLQQRRIIQGRPCKPFIINEQDRFVRVTILANWLHEKTGADPLNDFLSRPTNFWTHMTSTQRDYYVSKGLPSDKLYYFGCSTAELTFIDPELYENIHKGKRNTVTGLSARVKGHILSAGSNLRDYETLKRAATLIDSEIHVICDMRRYAAEGPPNLIWHDFVPVKQYIDALNAADVIVVPLQNTNLSGGENTITYSWALGKPVVATRVEATTDFAEHGHNALLVPPGDAVALARAIKETVGNRDLATRLAENGRRKERELDGICRKHMKEAFDRAFKVSCRT